MSRIHLKIHSLFTIIYRNYKNLPDQKGQAFFEFLLLLLAIFTITIFFYTAINGELANIWEGIVNFIANYELQGGEPVKI